MGVEDTQNSVCTTRSYGLSAASERTSFASYTSGANTPCQNTSPTMTKTYTYDTANRIRNTGYTYDSLGRTLTTSADDTAPGGAGPLTATYFSNDMVKSLLQTIDDGLGGTITKETAYELDPTGRIGSITKLTGGIESSRLRYRFSGESDSPSSIQASTDAGASWTTTRYISLPGVGLEVTAHQPCQRTTSVGNSKLLGYELTDEFDAVGSGTRVRRSMVGTFKGPIRLLEPLMGGMFRKRFLLGDGPAHATQTAAALHCPD